MENGIMILSVVAFVEGRVRSGVRYEELSKAVGFSLPHLRAVFARHTGQPLARYIMGRRIARAAFDAVHSADPLLEIAGRYGFTNPDTFTRAFKRVTGMTPREFRRLKPHVGRVRLCAGVFGVSPQGNITERMKQMNSKHISDGSVILYGVPKVGYGSFGGATPYPIFLKSVANYLGEDLDYSDAIVMCGAAFRLVWDTAEWNGGNVDVLLAFDDPETVFRSGIEALGREFKILWRNNVTAGPDGKDAFIAFIKESIDKGVPVIALGIIGPPEACVITGYRDNGNTLLGWNCFQHDPEFAPEVTFDESGYFVTSSWWENRDTVAVMSLGEKTGGRASPEAVARLAVTALEGKRRENYAVGTAAYDAWKKALLDESQFAADMIVPLQAERMMCQGDGMDCVSDGRGNAAKYFHKLAERHPEQPLYESIAKQFGACCDAARRMYLTLGGHERGETQMKALMNPETRRRLGELIGECKTADQKALKHIQQLLSNC